MRAGVAQAGAAAVVKIKGETIRDGADFVQGLGRTAAPAGTAVSNVLTEAGRRLKPGGMGRKARLVEFEEADYRNADDWTAADKNALTVHASVSTGGNTVDIPETVEFVHFGRVYKDGSQLFRASKIDDTKAGDVLKEAIPGNATDRRDLPAHGLMFRAALMRETVLLGGFIRAQMDALLQEEKSKGVVGVLGQILADMTGSAGGTQDKPSAVDLNPHLQKVIDAGKKINRPKIDYPALHTAGIELHTARRAYREYLVKELEKRHAPAKTPNPGGGVLNEQLPHVNKALSEGKSWLGNAQDVVPKLTSIVPPNVQDFLSLAQKISFKAWDVYAGLIYEYAIRLEPIVEDASRNMTVQAIRKRSTPIFPVWFLEAQQVRELPADIEQQIFEKVENPVPKGPKLLQGISKALNNVADVVTDPVKDALNDYDAKVGIDKTLDFLSRPDRYTPGRPFLDDIFLVPPDPGMDNLPEGDRRARRGWSSGLGAMAVESFKGALGVEKLPSFLEWTVGRVSTVSAEFVRGIYGKVLTLRDTDQVTEAEIHEAAKRHFVGNIVESILGGLRFTDKLRKVSLDFPIGNVAMSVDALIGRSKEFATVKLERFVDPIVKYAMRDLHASIFAYRQTAIQNNALTMEVHLAQLPILFARLFRNTFFPLWDKVLERVLEGVTASLMPKLPAAAQQILGARDQVDMVRGKITKTLAGLDTLPSKLPDVGFDFKHPKDSIKQIKKDWNPLVEKAKDAYDEAELETTQDLPMPQDALITSFPLTNRVAIAEVMDVTDEHLAKVRPQLKWLVADDEAEGEDESSTGDEADADVAPPASVPASQQLPNPYAPPQLDQGYSSYATMTAQSSPYGGGTPYAGHVDFGPPPSSQFIPASASSPGISQSEVTEQLDPISPELREMANLDPELTVDLPSSAISVLPPFLGTKKA